MVDDDIQKGLEREARLVTERMPMDATELNAREKARSLREFMKARGYTQALIAERIGMSSGVISSFLKGDYKGDVPALINKVVDLINSVTSRERRIRNKPYIKTTVAKCIGDLIAQTIAFSQDQGEGKIGLVIGDSGHGKSTCLRQYAIAHENAIYVEMRTTMTARSLFAQLAIHPRIGEGEDGSLDNIAERLIINLRKREVVIIIDEASGVTVTQLNQLRTVIVVSACCPLILAGNRYLMDTVMQQSTRRGFESLDQFRGRLMRILNLDAMAAEKDGGGIYTVEDIRKLYEYGGVRLMPDAIKLLRRICLCPQTARLWTCGHIISALLTSGAVTEDGKIDAIRIGQAIQLLRLPLTLPLYSRDAAEEQAEEQIGRVG
jgi:DNA transposition AAA+ family ATPase